MVTLRTHRRVTIVTRILAGVVSAVSLALFISILVKVFDKRFPADKPGYSVFPVAALALGIIWNVVALMTYGKFGRFFHPASDGIVMVEVAVLGSIGFAHDDVLYLSNGHYLTYDNNDWLMSAIVGGSFGIVAILLQLFLAIWGLIKPTHNTGAVLEPPPYEEGDDVKEEKHGKEKDFDTYWDGISSVNLAPSVHKGDDEKV